MMKDTLRKLEIYPPPGKPSSPPTWEDVERLALHYAVVHRAVALVRRGEFTREEALIHVAFALAGAFQQLFQAEVERKMLEVAPMIIVKPSSSPAEERAARLEAGLRYIYLRGYPGAASIANDVLEGKDLPDDDYRIVAERNP